MRKFLVVGDSHAQAFVGDEELNGCEVVISTYEAEGEEEAKSMAIQEYNGLQSAKLTAYELK